MVVSLTPIDRFALMLYTIFLGGALGGAWMSWRFTGKQRMWGIVILAESAAAIILLTLMSTDFWISGARSGLIDIGVRFILLTLSYILPPLGLGMAILIALAFFTIKLMHSGKPFLGQFILCLLIPVVFAASVVQLISLTKLNRPVLPDPASDIIVSPGFSVIPILSEPANNPTSIIFSDKGDMYIANYNGDIWLVSSRDGLSVRFATGFTIPVGLAWRHNSLYLASRGKITVLRDTDGDNVADEVKDIVTGLPAGIYPWHANNGLVFGGDERLYFAVGSTTDAAPESRQYAASILSVEADGSDLQTYAVGVRNPYRLAFNSTGDLFATDNGPGLLDVTPPDELNHIVENADYGFPQHFGIPPPASGTSGPIALFPPHSSADGITFYEGDQFPSIYHDNAFVTLWSLGQIYRVQLTKGTDGNYHTLTSVFVTGLENPVDITLGPNGSMYVLDFGDSVIYEIAYTGIK